MEKILEVDSGLDQFHTQIFLLETYALVTNEVVATLPSGYRPSEIIWLVTYASGGTSRLQVEPNGAIKLVSGNNSGVGLSFLFGLN
ncbi:hypothetical protein [Tolypothrix sp. VBCCA 56010]|uniref:hypothetical protein n=1 Tax=Tolypothrix sp. VBCCA 56010 TaxID=3137731 RepID=UPI003D7DA583